MYGSLSNGFCTRIGLGPINYWHQIDIKVWKDSAWMYLDKMHFLIVMPGGVSPSTPRATEAGSSRKMWGCQELLLIHCFVLIAMSKERYDGKHDGHKITWQHSRYWGYKHMGDPNLRMPETRTHQITQSPRWHQRGLVCRHTWTRTCSQHLPFGFLVWAGALENMTRWHHAPVDPIRSNLMLWGAPGPPIPTSWANPKWWCNQLFLGWVIFRCHL